jgi:hypothetical protein
LTPQTRVSTNGALPGSANPGKADFAHPRRGRIEEARRSPLGSVIKKRRKKMRKHKQRKLLKRQRHKK